MRPRSKELEEGRHYGEGKEKEGLEARKERRSRRRGERRGREK